MGGDGYLYVLRASVHLASGDIVAVVETCQATIDAEPELPNAYWILVQVSLQQREYPLTVTLLDHLEKRLGAKLGDLQVAAAFKDFVKSAEFRKWDDSRLSK